jgi:hypothetical protein
MSFVYYPAQRRRAVLLSKNKPQNHNQNKGIQPMFATPIFPYSICRRRTKKAKLVLGICLILLLIPKGGYAMQPPPPPLNIAQLKMLIAQADLIVVGKITAVKETEGTVEATVHIEKLLKGKAAGKTIGIKETYQPASFQTPATGLKDEGESPQMLVHSTAGPSTYHGKYKKDGRIIVLLEKIKGTANYRPLGSGTYDKYLCEFLIENDGIKSINTNYFQFAKDVEKYAASEKSFIGFIKKLINLISTKGGNNG